VVDNNKYLEYDDDYDEILNQLLGKLYAMGKFDELFPGQQVRWDMWDGCFTDGLELGLQVKLKHDPLLQGFHLFPSALTGDAVPHYKADEISFYSNKEFFREARRILPKLSFTTAVFFRLFRTMV
jgi:hypothetical protein